MITSTRLRPALAIAASLTAASLMLAGCGDSDDKAKPAASSAGVTSATESATTSATTTEATETTATDTEATSSAAVDVPAEVTVTGVNGRDVTMTGPIAVKYTAATAEQKQALGKPLDGDFNAGTRDSGVVYQQFEGGVITAKNDSPGTPAYITTGKIREAWNVERDADGKPVTLGSNGSAGPLGAVTSDEITTGDTTTTTFEHGSITLNNRTGEVQVTVNGKSVDSGL